MILEIIREELSLLGFVSFGVRGGKVRVFYRLFFKGNYFRMIVWIFFRENLVVFLDNYLLWKDFLKMLFFF